MIPLLLLLAQVTPVAPIVRGTALPPPGTEEGEVMAPINVLLGALTTDDGTAVLAVTLPEGSITAARTAPDGSRQHRTLRWAEFAASLKSDGTRVEERLGTPAIEIDGDVAMVWAPFTVLENGAAKSCGYDHFDLIRTDAGWRILNTTYSARTMGCEANP